MNNPGHYAALLGKWLWKFSNSPLRLWHLILAEKFGFRLDNEPPEGLLASTAVVFGSIFGN